MVLAAWFLALSVSSYWLVYASADPIAALAGLLFQFFGQFGSL